MKAFSYKLVFKKIFALGTEQFRTNTDVLLWSFKVGAKFHYVVLSSLQFVALLNTQSIVIEKNEQAEGNTLYVCMCPW